MNFEVNVGKKDSMIRMGVGALLFLLALVGTIGFWGYIVGVALVASGYLKTCYVYKYLGKSTVENG